MPSVMHTFLWRKHHGLLVACLFLLLVLLMISSLPLPDSAPFPFSPPSPRGILPSSPRGILPSSPRGILPSSPRGILPSSPRGVACPGVSFSHSPLLRTALASFPGSGNTWVRHLLEKMTGIYTGSVYFDVYLYNKGFKGENRTDRSVLVVKTHRNLNLTRADDPVYERVILLLRNPYDALLADFRRLYSVGRSHTGNVDIDTFCSAWGAYFAEYIDLFRSFHLSWLLHGNIHIIFYDDLLKDLRKELVRTLHYLNLPPTTTGNIQCVADQSTGSFRRNHTYNMPVKFFYSTQKKEILNQLILEFNEHLTKRFPGASFDIMKTWVK